MRVNECNAFLFTKNELCKLLVSVGLNFLIEELSLISTHVFKLAFSYSPNFNSLIIYFQSMPSVKLACYPLFTFFLIYVSSITTEQTFGL